MIDAIPGLQQELAKIIEGFLERAREELQEVRTLLRTTGPDGDAARERVVLVVHRIRGTSALFGFSALSNCAAQLELAASAVDETRLEEWPAQRREQCRLLLNDLEDLLAAALAHPHACSAADAFAARTNSSA